MATPLPTKTVLMTPLPAESKEAQLWSQNQKQSGFLRLPAEIRNAIYDLALGNKHIIVLHTPITVRPFRYCAQVYHKRPSQLRIGTTPTGRHSVGMTLLSGVCRQLYQETHLLAYKYNTWSFPSPLIMWNFLYHGRKLSREQLSMIEHLQVNEEPPSGALLQLLPGLKTVRLFDCWSEDYNQNGIYLVERQEKEVRLVLQFRQRY